jgi:hypothetical protein
MGDTADTVNGKKPPARDVLVDLVEQHYRIGRAEDERPFIVPRDGPNIALFSGRAKAELARRYRAETGQTVGRSPLDEAWQTIEGESGLADKQALPLRVATTGDGSAVIDIGDSTGDVIIVNEDGWNIESVSPVTFRRSKAMLPLHRPEPGGNLDALFELLPIVPASRDLFTAWLTIALVENLPHPAPVFRGEQGSGKSTAAKIATRLLDPCVADTQMRPPNDEEWAQTCTARWLINVDNVSTVPEWWSDALCRTITGDGWLRRQLYTDGEVAVTKWRRCVILNGITLGGSLRPDLAERLVFFDLDRPDKYLTEAQILNRLNPIAPGILGALLDRLAATIAEHDRVNPVSDLRMADFANWLAAYDQAHDTKALAAYRGEVDAAFNEALADDTVATAVIEFMEDRTEWVGKATELYRMLNKPDGDPYWPKAANHLSGALTRSAPALRRIGIVWEKPPRSGRERFARLRWDPPPGDDGDDGDDHLPLVVSSLSPASNNEEMVNEANTTRGKGPSPSSQTVTAPPGDERCLVCGEVGYRSRGVGCEYPFCEGF